MNFHVFEMRTGMNVYNHRTVLALLSSTEKDLKNLGLAMFLKVPKLSGPISGATIPVLSSQRRAPRPSNFVIFLVFLTSKTCQKISFSKQADCSLTTGFSVPKSSRDFRETGPRLNRQRYRENQITFQRRGIASEIQ